MIKRWAIIVLLVTILILLRNRMSSGFKDIQAIPKTIWTYWDGPDPPESVKKCMSTWRKYNPDYTINLINRDNLARFLPGVDIFGMKMATTPQRTADLVRVHVLAEHGGVWCDATIMMTGPLNFVHKNGNRELVGYHIVGGNTKPEWPVIENWFFACPPGSEFVIRWRDAFVKINEFDTADNYVEYMKSQGVFVDGISLPNYLTMHVAAQYVIQKQMAPEDVAAKLRLEKAEDGPFRHLARNDWDAYKGVMSLCSEKATELPPIIKFRGVERDKIEEHKELGCVFNGHV
jgi:hypothetical protein